MEEPGNISVLHLLDFTGVCNSLGSLVLLIVTSLRDEIRDLPDDGWYDSYGEDTYVDVAEYLVRRGIEEDKVVVLLQRIYWATRNEFY